jgi:hypothetical protein
MPKEPDDFDCRSVRHVLKLRFRDWMWPTAIAITVLVPWIATAQNDAEVLSVMESASANAQPNPPGSYRIGSLTYYLNAYGPLVMLAAMGFAGVRWCWLGHLRPREDRRCARCGYPIDGFADAPPNARCSECGADATVQRTPTVRSWLRESFRGVTIARLAIDLPGLLLLGFVAFVFVLITLVVFGVVPID